MTPHQILAGLIALAATGAVAWAALASFSGPASGAVTGLTPGADDLTIITADRILAPLRVELAATDPANPFAPPQPRAVKGIKVPLPPPPATAFPVLPVLPVAER